MLVTTGNNFEGYEIVDYIRIVRGIIVRATGVGAGILGGLKSLVGGNISEYEKVCERARAQAYDRMIQQAERFEADGIIAMRYDATDFTHSVTEVFAYGTAVKLKKIIR